ncbi:hypothetical protein HK405_010127 [Cladochytrium tenue]|nr:hypothetical protein HK405_010127 [Cladochytrium tenue]
MSWKGLTKAVARFPQYVMSKTGYAGTTSDPEFDAVEERLRYLDTSARKLHDDARKFKDAIVLMLAHQDSFALTLREVYEPIAPPVFAAAAAVDPQGSELRMASRTGGSTKSLPRETPAASMRAAIAFSEFSTAARASLGPDLEVIERGVVAPTAELIVLLDNVKRVVLKRSHKLLDYDRHRESVRKLREKPDRTSADEKALGKCEAAFEQAARDFDHINSLLKQQLPQLLALKAAFIDPCFRTLYRHQLRVHRCLADGYRHLVATEPALAASSLSAAMAFEARAAQQAALLDDLALLSRNRKTLSAGTAALSPTSATSPVDEGYQTGSSADPSPVDQNFGGSAGNVSDDYDARAFDFAGMHKALAPSPWAAASPTEATPSSNAGARFVVALYDYAAQADGDLSFHRDDRIELVAKTDDAHGWWTGRLRGVTGVFPGNYVTEV